MKIYITGNQGMLGQSLMKILSKCHEVSGSDILTGVDIVNYEQIKSDIEKFNPDIIINSAAYIDIEKAEKEPLKCYNVNVVGVENLVKICDNKIKFIQISTPCVNVNSIYGCSKNMAEKYVIGDNAIIVRTNIFGNKGFTQFIKNEKNKIYDDIYGNWIFVDDLAQIINDKLCNGYSYNAIDIVNISTRERISKSLFASLIMGYSVKTCHSSKRFKELHGEDLYINSSILTPSIFKSIQNYKDSL